MLFIVSYPEHTWVPYTCDPYSLHVYYLKNQSPEQQQRSRMIFGPILFDLQGVWWCHFDMPKDNTIQRQYRKCSPPKRQIHQGQLPGKWYLILVLLAISHLSLVPGLQVSLGKVLTSLLKYPLTLEWWPITIYGYQASLKRTCTCTFRGKNS